MQIYGLIYAFFVKKTTKIPQLRTMHFALCIFFRIFAAK